MINHLKTQLRKRYRAVLAIPAWTEQELGALAPRLREYVVLGEQQRDRILERLRW